jgi:glycosyltransferase involved in cell wall biosynthesis
MRTRSRPFTVLATNPNADFYGASRMLLEAVDGFLARGWRVVVCIPDGPLVAEIESRGAEVRFAPSPVLRRTSLTPKGLLALIGLTLRSIWGNVALIRSVRPDVMYVNTIIQPLWLVLGWVLRTPVACHVHEAESTLPAFVRKALAAPLWFARRIIVNSKFCERVFVDAWPRLESRYDIVYNGVGGPPSVIPPRAEITEPIRLLYIGRFSERKGVQDAVDTLGRLDAEGVVAQLDMVGDVFPGYEFVVDDIHRRAAEAGTTDRLQMHGFDTDIWPYLADADILLVPSRLEETFGNVAIEGLRAARPIVVSRTSGLLEAADGFGAAVGFPPGDAAALTNAIRDIAEHWSEYRDRALADATRATDSFSLDRYRNAMCAVIEHAAPDAPS